MEEAALLARVTLIAVLGIAALAKMRSAHATTDAANAMGVPPALAAVVGPLLAPVEFGIAVLLVPGATAFGALVGALILLTLFTVLIARNLKADVPPSCNCFGSSSDEPISSRTLLRNLLLLAVAAVALAAGPNNNPGLVAGVERRVQSAGLAATLAAVMVIVVLQAAILLALYLRQARTVHPGPVAPLEPAPPAPTGGWPPGTRAPDFSLDTADGLRMSLRDLLRRDKPTVLVFTDPGCAPCNALLPEVAEWQESFRDRLSVVVIGSGTLDDNRAKRDALGLRDVLVQPGDEVAAGYRYLGTPGAVSIDEKGRIASRVATGASAIRSLVLALADDLRPPAAIEAGSAPRLPPQLPMGEAAPAVLLPNLRSGDVDLAEFQGGITAVLFWSPTCVHCQAVRPKVVEWEQANTDVQLVAIAGGGRAANELQRFPFPVLLDDDGSTMRAFGAVGTPSVVLIDATGRVASTVGVGGDEVMSLLHRASTLARTAKVLSTDRP